MKISEVLSSAGKWTQGTSARDKNGISVAATSPEADKWCLLGAAKVCYPDPGNLYSSLDRLYRALQKHDARLHSLSAWNDYPGRAFWEIQELLKEAGE